MQRIESDFSVYLEQLLAKRNMKFCAAFVVMSCLIGASIAVPVQQQQQQQQIEEAHIIVPALDGLIQEAAQEVQAIRKARQILDVDIGVFNGGMWIDLESVLCAHV